MTCGGVRKGGPFLGKKIKPTKAMEWLSPNNSANKGQSWVAMSLVSPNHVGLVGEPSICNSLGLVSLFFSSGFWDGTQE